MQSKISWVSTYWWAIKRFFVTKVSHKKHHMMGKSEELCQDLHNLTVAKQSMELVRCSSELLNLSVSTIKAIIYSWKEHHSAISWPCTGAPGKVVDLGDRRIVRRANGHSERALERVSRCNSYRENDPQCSPRAWPLCMLTPQESITEEKACWCSFKVCV